MTFVLAHLSDAHIGPLPRPRRRDLLGKRLTGYVNWSRRSHLHDMTVLRALVEDLRARRTDHVAMTGDILNLGLAAEFPFAEAWLRTLGEPGDVRMAVLSYIEPLSTLHLRFAVRQVRRTFGGAQVVLGNHDAYVRSSMALLASTFLPWLADGPGVPAPGHAPHFPFLRRRGEVALVGLSSAVPTAPFLASGALGARQRHALGALLDTAAAEDRARVVLIHHPPYRHGASAGRGLRDQAAFAQVIAAHGAELILHGHNHRPMLAHMRGPDGPVPVVGVPSASAVPGSASHRAAYHLFSFGRAGRGWSIGASRRGLLPDLSGIGDLGAFDLTAGA